MISKCCKSKVWALSSDGINHYFVCEGCDKIINLKDMEDVE